MIIPTLQGTIDRRILINFQVEQEVLNNFLPKPFKAKLVNGKGMAGICLIRLKEIRLKGFPKQLGIASENGAHRIAVEWIENGVQKEGVYIPRRDTSSKLNAFAGGTLFPGVHHLAQFVVNESAGAYEVAFKSDDDTTLSIKAQETQTWPADSIFENLSCASAFFQNGALGYSPGGSNFQGIELKTNDWKVHQLAVVDVQSSFFENEKVFPKGSVKFDNALLMKNIEHEWVGLKSIAKS